MWHLCSSSFLYLRQVIFPYSYWGINTVAEEPIHCYLVTMWRERASFAGPLLTAQLAVRCTKVAFIPRPEGHAIRGPHLHRIKAFLLDRTAMHAEMGRLQKPLERNYLRNKLLFVGYRCLNPMHSITSIFCHYLLLILSFFLSTWPLTFNLWHLFLKKWIKMQYRFIKKYSSKM